MKQHLNQSSPPNRLRNSDWEWRDLAMCLAAEFYLFIMMVLALVCHGSARAGAWAASAIVIGTIVCVRRWTLGKRF